MDKDSFLVKWGASIFGIGIVIIIWQLATETFGLLPEIVMPSPTDIMGAFMQYNDLIMKHFWSTVTVAAVGFFSVVILGVVFGSLFAMSEWVYETFMPLVVAGNSVPRVALAPLILFYVGDFVSADMAKYVIAAWVAFFGLFVNVIEGLETIDEEEYDLFASLGATPWQRYRKLLVWNALPHFFDGLKLATTGAIVGAVVSEYVEAKEGIGYIVLFALGGVQFDIVFAAVGLMSLVALSLFLSFFVLQSKVIFWQNTDLF
ncbi:MAG: ABC transporter permease [Halobacteriota archaeon]